MNEYLSKVTGLIHVGAHIGQERDLYSDLKVIWIEANPEVFKGLEENIKNYGNQIAFCALITDRDGKDEIFHICNDNASPSSLFEFGRHKELWPNLFHIGTVQLKSTTLTTLIKNNRISMSDYQALVIDVQGAELLVLKGAIPLLPNFKFIKLEVADCEAYLGGCQLSDIEPFMKEHGFVEICRDMHEAKLNDLHYWDITYGNQS